jgi:hypothetical protein
MRHIIEAGTDGGSVCFFDPAALPEDFDMRVPNEAGEIIDTLATQGRMWWGGDGDGGYLMHLS